MARCSNFPERCRGCTLASLASPEGDLQLKPGDTLAVIIILGIRLINSLFLGEVPPTGEEPCGGSEPTAARPQHGGRKTETSA